MIIERYCMFKDKVFRSCRIGILVVLSHPCNVGAGIQHCFSSTPNILNLVCQTTKQNVHDQLTFIEECKGGIFLLEIFDRINDFTAVTNIKLWQHLCLLDKSNYLYTSCLQFLFIKHFTSFIQIYCLASWSIKILYLQNMVSHSNHVILERGTSTNLDYLT